MLTEHMRTRGPTIRQTGQDVCAPYRRAYLLISYVPEVSACPNFSVFARRTALKSGTVHIPRKCMEFMSASHRTAHIQIVWMGRNFDRTNQTLRWSRKWQILTTHAEWLLRFVNGTVAGWNNADSHQHRHHRHSSVFACPHSRKSVICVLAHTRAPNHPMKYCYVSTIQICTHVVAQRTHRYCCAKHDDGAQTRKQEPTKKTCMRCSRIVRPATAYTNVRRVVLCARAWN